MGQPTHSRLGGPRLEDVNGLRVLWRLACNEDRQNMTSPEQCIHIYLHATPCFQHRRLRGFQPQSDIAAHDELPSSARYRTNPSSAPVAQPGRLHQKTHTQLPLIEPQPIERSTHPLRRLFPNQLDQPRRESIIVFDQIQGKTCHVIASRQIMSINPLPLDDPIHRSVIRTYLIVSTS